MTADRPLFQTQQDRAELINRARQEQADRSRRAERFGPDLFGEPGWDMLLAIYVNDGTAQMTVHDAIKYSGTSSATAVRWLGYLEKRHLIEWRAHPAPGGANFVQLTKAARSSLDAHFGELLHSIRGAA